MTGLAFKFFEKDIFVDMKEEGVVYSKKYGEGMRGRDGYYKRNGKAI